MKTSENIIGLLLMLHFTPYPVLLNAKHNHIYFQCHFDYTYL